MELPRLPVRLALALGAIALSGLALVSHALRPVEADEPDCCAEPHRSPIALAVSADGKLLLSANQTADSVSLVDTESGKVLHEFQTGRKPAGVAFTPDARRAVVTHWYGYDLAVLDVADRKLTLRGRVQVGPEPRGVAVAPDGAAAYVAVGVANEVVRVDLEGLKVTGRVEVGREPRGIAITPDGTRLVVGNARSGSLSVISVGSLAVERTLPIEGENLRQVAVSGDGISAYVANMKNRRFPTTQPNIDKGWVLGQRLTRVPVDASEPYSTLSLDPQGQATADAHGAAISGDGRYLAVSCGGTHEVLLFQTDLKPLPWRANGARDLIAPELLKRGDGRFRRVPVGGRPTELAFAPDRKTLYVANYLADSIQVVDAEGGSVVRSIPLGGPSELSLERRGEVVFHDASKSFNQWYSCNTCHSDGHTNGATFDTMNDGWHDNSVTHLRSQKKVLTLRDVTHTGPWTWHGWQKSLEDSVRESFTKSMQGPKPNPDDVKAMMAYLGTLEYPPNPYREPDGSLSEAAERGEAVFRSAKAACNTCHGGPDLTDGRIHKVGLEEPGDVYRGYNPPSLRGVYDKDPYLHDGRAESLRKALTGPHNPESVTGVAGLSDQELEDLIAYLKTL
jgi:YVTN family beta-propeller protein